MTAIIVKPPQRLNDFICLSQKNLFLAGSIEMGKAENWQFKVEEELKRFHSLTIFNPRRDDWDSSWTQDINNPKFYEQVTWELTAIEKSDVVAMYLAPGTMSPISLLELGLVCGSDARKLVVFCTKEFHRKGNVDIVCQRYGVPVHEKYDTWITNIKNKLI